MMKLRKPFGNILYLLACVAAVPLLILIFNYGGTDNKAKFEATALNTDIISFEKDWGPPDEKFVEGKDAVYKYEADVLGWSKYVFVFEGDFLSKKAIDD